MLYLNYNTFVCYFQEKCAMKNRAVELTSSEEMSSERGRAIYETFTLFAVQNYSTVNNIICYKKGPN